MSIFKNKEILFHLNEQEKHILQNDCNIKEIKENISSIKSKNLVNGERLDRVEELLQQNIVCLNKIEELLLQNRNELDRMPGNLRKLKRDILKPVLWANETERIIISENWADVVNDDISEKYVKLVKGLDAKSVETINKILLRTKKLITNSESQVDLFTRKEQEELRLLKENFFDEILHISDEMWAWRNYILPYNHFEASVFYYRQGLNEVENLESVTGKTVIDVGAYIGDSALVLEDLKPNKIVSFEADINNFKLLQRTMDLNNIDNVVAENLALGNRNGKITLHTADSSTTTIDRPGIEYGEDLEVQVTTLDDYVKEHDLTVGLIKVDIEGGEPLFLEGAKHTICTQKPIILLSIYHNSHDFFELKPLLESWNLGYRFKVYKPTLKKVTSECILIAEI